MQVSSANCPSAAVPGAFRIWTVKLLLRKWQFWVHPEDKQANGLVVGCRLLWSATVADPTIQRPGFDLSHHKRSLPNSFHTGQGLCLATLHTKTLPTQLSVNVNNRPWTTYSLTKFERGLQCIHNVKDDALYWLKTRGENKPECTGMLFRGPEI